MKDNESAFPVRSRWDLESDSFDVKDSGMTAQEYAAIHLKVPRSGDAEIDEMIRESRRADFAGQALAGIAYKEKEDFVAGWSWDLADSMLAEWEKEAGK
jgi:hypothetical protein